MKNIDMLKRFLFETSIIIVGISISFWISEVQKDIENQNKEQKLLKTIKINIDAVGRYTNGRLDLLEEENNLMDHISNNWNNLNVDSLTKVLEEGTYVKSFHNLFLDYREFHPPVSELKAIVDDGSLGLIRDENIRLAITTLLDDRLDFLLQNINSEIQLQQSFRENLLYEKSDEIVSVLRTSNSEMKDRISGNLGYTSRVKEELNAITSLKSAENYLNLKIRQRFWVMFFMKNFNSSLAEINDLVINNIDD